jgi:regulator of nucleoside diphosphate kinase
MDTTAERTLYITATDYARLEKLIETARRGAQASYIQDLEAELAHARIVPEAEIPQDVVTMHSRVLLVDLETGERLECTLVFPHQADTSRQRISVLAPIGTAMLGYRSGDSFTWQVPRGPRRMEIRRVLYQPEAAGDPTP